MRDVVEGIGWSLAFLAATSGAWVFVAHDLWWPAYAQEINRQSPDIWAIAVGVGSVFLACTSSLAAMLSTVFTIIAAVRWRRLRFQHTLGVR